MEPQVDVEGMEGLIAGMGVLMGVVALLIGLAISALVCYLIFNCYRAIPQEHRKMEPGLVWLLMIPCFNIIWNFFVWLKLAQSYKSYFDAVGNTTVGECGYGLNLAYCIVTACAVLAFIPCLGPIIGLASLVLLIICLIKAYDLKGKIGVEAQP